MEKFISIDFIKDIALEIGFQGCGASKAEEIDISFLKEWLKKGYNADMQYMNNYIDKRANPSLLQNDSKSIISFIVSYNTDNKQYSNFKFAQYALFEDYHKSIKIKLYELINRIQETYKDFEAIAYVDSAPVFDKLWAMKSGLGYIGKNSCLINKSFGSKILIGEIVCNYYTDYYNGERENLCKNCTKCIESCPNKAIKENKEIDANYCISYQTIENKGIIPTHIDTRNYIFGCNICLDVCPWNKKTIINNSKFLKINDKLLDLQKSIISNTLDKSIFNKAKKNSAIERIKFEKLISNIEKTRF